MRGFALFLICLSGCLPGRPLEGPSANETDMAHSVDLGADGGVDLGRASDGGRPVDMVQADLVPFTCDPDWRAYTDPEGQVFCINLKALGCVPQGQVGPHCCSGTCKPPSQLDVDGGGCWWSCR